jgi:hypothetical protein
VSAFLVNSAGFVPFQSVVEIEEKSFDVASDVVPGRIQIPATFDPGLSWQKFPGMMTPKFTFDAGTETNWMLVPFPAP